jgi:hypothetical protein
MSANCSVTGPTRKPPAKSSNCSRKTAAASARGCDGSGNCSALRKAPVNAGGLEMRGTTLPLISDLQKGNETSCLSTQKQFSVPPDIFKSARTTAIQHQGPSRSISNCQATTSPSASLKGTRAAVSNSTAHGGNRQYDCRHLGIPTRGPGQGVRYRDGLSPV